MKDEIKDMKSEINELVKWKKRTQSTKDRIAEYLEKKIDGFIPYYRASEFHFYDIKDDAVGILFSQEVVFRDYERKNK